MRVLPAAGVRSLMRYSGGTLFRWRRVGAPFDFDEARFDRGNACAKHGFVSLDFEHAPVIGLGVAVEGLKELRFDAAHRFQKLVLGRVYGRFDILLGRGLVAVFHIVHLQSYNTKVWKKTVEVCRGTADRYPVKEACSAVMRHRISQPRLVSP